MYTHWDLHTFGAYSLRGLEFKSWYSLVTSWSARDFARELSFQHNSATYRVLPQLRTILVTPKFKKKNIKIGRLRIM